MVNVLQILAGLIFYWSVIFLVFGGVLNDDVLFTNNQYNTSGSFNSSFSNDEIDYGGGFFDTLGAIGTVIGSIGRFFGLILFGFTPNLSGALQTIFSTITIGINFFAIAVIVRLILD